MDKSPNHNLSPKKKGSAKNLGNLEYGGLLTYFRIKLRKE